MFYQENDQSYFLVIGLDEGQFFTDVVEFAENLANIGKTVVIAALDGTYQRQKFNRILELVPLSEHVVKLNAVCMMCAGDAAFTKRIKSNDDRLEVIGGAETYMATCRECHNEKGISDRNGVKKVTPFQLILEIGVLRLKWFIMVRITHNFL